MRKKDQEAPENVERWMLTYLDMITLLMAFFCILFAFSQVDAVKFKQVAQSMSMSFGTGGGSGQNMITNFSGTGIIPQMSSNSLIAIRENNQFKSIIKMLMDYAAQEGISKSIQFKITDRGLEGSFADNVLFESGKADLSSKSREILDKMASALFKVDAPIQVEGHTDDVPIHNEKYLSNWQLSTDRATNVIMYWISKYPDKAKNLSAAGYGEYHPVDFSNTPEGRAKNRRITIILLRGSASQNKQYIPQ
jgi:chemotaxis protein MotB